MSDEHTDKNRAKTSKGSPRFQKGNRANPHGRPKGSKNKVGLQLKELFASIVLSEAWQELFVRLAMKNKLPPAVLVQMFDRVGGKVKDTLEVTRPSLSQLETLSPEELALLDKVLGKLR